VYILPEMIQSYGKTRMWHSRYDFYICRFTTLKTAFPEGHPSFGNSGDHGLHRGCVAMAPDSWKYSASLANCIGNFIEGEGGRFKKWGLSPSLGLVMHACNSQLLGRIEIPGWLGQKARPYLKNNLKQKGPCAQGSKHYALSSNPNTAKKKDLLYYYAAHLKSCVNLHY
jgi:hypothetical protein